MEFGERLRMFREKAGLTQEELAERVGVAKTTITGYEKGNRSPDIPKIKKLAWALGITGDELLDTGMQNKKAPAISDGAMQIAKDYDGLDRWGKELVRSVVNKEMERCEYDREFFDKFVDTAGPRVIPDFLSLPAAGMAAPIMGEDYDDYTLKPDDPQGALFCVRISGDSMEPDFRDGSRVFCDKDPLEDGEIGVFAVDGDAVIKQYHYDRMMGITYLFSLNRKRADADVVLTPNSGRTLVCLGRVITKKRYRVPGM